MKFSILEITSGSNSLLYSATYEDGKISDAGFSKDIDGKSYICYDIFKFKKDVELKDLKVIYELLGYKFESFTELACKILGKEKINPYLSVLEKFNAHLKSYETCKIKINNFSVFSLFPSDLVDEYYAQIAILYGDLYIKSLKHLQVSSFYKSFSRSLGVFKKLSSSPLGVNIQSISQETGHYADLFRKLSKNGEIYLKFHPVGAKTGRISFEKGSINPYIIPKNLRKVFVAPNNYKLMQADFRAFQPRLAIFCTSDKDFKNKFSNIEDIYSVFPGDRDKNKIDFISWMFSNKRHELFDKEAKPILQLRQDLYSRSRKNNMLVNDFGRPLFYGDEEENVIFQNYITSVEADVVIKLMTDIDTHLEGMKSRIVFPFHDSLVFYIHNDEEALIKEIKHKMENYMKPIFGTTFPVSIKTGDDFLNMENYKGEMK